VAPSVKMIMKGWAIWC